MKTMTMTTMKWRTRLLLSAISVLVFQTAQGQITTSRHDHADIHRGVENYVRTQSAGSPHKIAYTLTPIDPRLTLPACPAVEYFAPAGARLWGQTAVGVRCGAPSWTVFVTVRITVTGNYVVLTRAISQGQVLTAADVAIRSGDLTQLPAGVLSDIDQAEGKIAGMALGADQPLSRDSLRRPVVVQQGQNVVLQSAGRGFRVTAEGRALNNAQAGQVAQVRTASGQTVSGIARPSGIVEITQ